MRHSYLIIIASTIILSVMLSSCKNVLGPTNGQSDIVFPATNVSFYKQVLPLFEVTCNYSGCHDDGTQAGGLDLTNYASLISAPGVVIPRDTVSSVLLQRVKGTGPIMPPPPFPTLNSNQINGIKVWILEGAKAN